MLVVCPRAQIYFMYIEYYSIIKDIFFISWYFYIFRYNCLRCLKPRNKVPGIKSQCRGMHKGGYAVRFLLYVIVIIPKLSLVVVLTRWDIVTPQPDPLASKAVVERLSGSRQDSIKHDQEQSAEIYNSVIQ